MKQWEYCAFRTVDASVAYFNELGLGGWELVCFDANGYAWFKRAL